MKTRVVILFLLIFSPSLSFSQIMFQKTYGGSSGDFGADIQQTSDGGFIATGYSMSFGMNASSYLLKLGASGYLQWTKTFDDPDTETGQSVRQMPSGGYIVGGTTSSFSGTGIYLIRTNLNGDTIWTKVIKGKNGTSLKCNSLQTTPDSGFVIAGTAGSGPFKSYIAKFDSNGDTIWLRTFSQAEACELYDISPTSDGGYIAAGWIYLSGEVEALLLKTDINGNLQWTKAYGEVGPDRVVGLSQTTDSGYVLTGYAERSGNRDVVLIKTDANGVLQWTKTYGGSGYDQGISIEQRADGGFVIAGGTESFGAAFDRDAYLVRTNSIGDTLWTKAYGGTGLDDVAIEIKTTNLNGLIVIGSTESFGSGDHDLYVIRTDSSGNSGCSEMLVPTNVNTLNLNTTIPSITSLGGGLILRVPTQVGSGGTKNDCSTVSVNDYESKHIFLLSPNPSPGKISIAFETEIQNGNYEVLDIFGKIVLSGTISNESKKEILLNNVSDGIYVVKLFDGEKYQTGKLIVEKD